MYAILDIETTGGQYNQEGITEIAIYKFDGNEIIDQFCSLINPEIPIQPFVVQLTGINNNMLRAAPKFFEVAKRIIEITTDCIVVAHNASFDYRILKTEFNRLGYNFESKALCTVELAKKLIPNEASYSLGKLVRSLGIPITDRHRASGDALATLKLFKILLEKDSQKIILNDAVKLEIEKKITPKLHAILEKMPNTTGVYYIYDEKGTLIYIGKSKNIKKRINQHFTGQSRKAKKIQMLVFSVLFEETGNELIALLKESEAIKINKPILNRAQRKTIFDVGLYASKNEKGYTTLHIEKADGRKKEIMVFTNYEEAKNFMFRMAAKFSLCQKYTALYKTDGACFQYKIKECDGACIEKVPTADYNQRVQNFITENSFENQNKIIIDKGRKIDEKSAILIKNGVYKGYTFFDLNYQITTIEILEKIIIPMQNNRDVKMIIQSYLKLKEKTKPLKTINF